MFALPLMFSPASSAPVPPGPDLAVNKYFDVDDRLSDGWANSTSAGVFGVAASMWYATPSTGRQEIKKTNLSAFAVGTKIRMKCSFSGGSFGFPTYSGRVYSSIILEAPVGGAHVVISTNNISTFGTTDVHHVTFSANGTGGGSFWTDEATAVPATSPIWIELHKTGASEITANVYDGSFTLIKQRAISIAYAYQTYYAQVDAASAGTLTRTPDVDQLSYTSVF